MKAGDQSQGDNAESRLAAIRKFAPLGNSDDLELRQVTRLTGISDRDGDSLHRLVMDLHKALNRLAASHADEILAGAHVSGLLPDDRPAVEAFMRGVEATGKLKFGHPGLATTEYRRSRRPGGRTQPAKVGVEGSNPFAHSNKINNLDNLFPARDFPG